MAGVRLTEHGRRVLSGLAYDSGARLVCRLGDKTFRYVPSGDDLPKADDTTLSVAAARKYAGKGLLTLDKDGSSVAEIRVSITHKGRKAVQG